LTLHSSSSSEMKWSKATLAGFIVLGSFNLLFVYHYVLGGAHANVLCTAILALLPIVGSLCWLTHSTYTTIELHGYQKDFLDSLCAMPGPWGSVDPRGASGALQSIVDLAMSNAKVKADIFGEVQCLHCTSAKPAAWIADNMEKFPHRMLLEPDAAQFLASELLLDAQVFGTKKVKKLVEGPRKADASKAARCCVDWAIKAHGATADGKIPFDPTKHPTANGSKDATAKRSKSTGEEMLQKMD